MHKNKKCKANVEKGNANAPKPDETLNICAQLLIRRIAKDWMFYDLRGGKQ